MQNGPERTNSFHKPPAGETYHAVLNFWLFGPICEGHEWNMYVEYLDWAQQTWVPVGHQAVPTTPAPGACTNAVRPMYDLPIGSTTPHGQYQIYISDVPLNPPAIPTTASGEYLLDVADFYIEPT